MSDPKWLVEQCMHDGLKYLKDSLGYYWPAKKDSKGNFNAVTENNIALHLARSFAKKGFRMWAEVPFVDVNKRLDFFAYHVNEKIAIVLELKSYIKQESESLEDLKRLRDIANSNLANADSVNVEGSKWMYGFVTLLYQNEFAGWWNDPEGYVPPNRKIFRAECYKRIGEALAKACIRKTEEIKKWENSCTHAAYALYDENTISGIELGYVLGAS